MGRGNVTHGDVMVVGGGISGIQAALDLATTGFKVFLVEKAPTIGGKMAQLDKTFPTNDCSMCIESPKFIECDRHPNIEILTYTEVDAVEGRAGLGEFFRHDVLILLDESSTTLLASGADLDRDGRVTMINRTGCELLGRPEEEIIGRDWFGEFLPQELSALVRADFERLVEPQLLAA